MFPAAGGVRKLALKKGPFPGIYGFDRFLARYPHAARTHIPVVVAIPIRRHMKLCFCSRSRTVGESANPQLSAASFEDQCRMWIALCIQLLKCVVATFVAEKHHSLTSRRPPNNHFRSTYEHSFRQNLGWDRPAQLDHQINQHLWRGELPFAQARSLIVVEDFVEGHKRVSVRNAVIAARPVNQECSTESEVLT